jgi:hypothetical protein
MIFKKKIPHTLSLVIFCSIASAEERIDMQGTSVIGNSEMPNVLYVVPWKRTPDPDLNPELYESLIEDQLKPIDKNVFQKRIKHFYSNK